MGGNTFRFKRFSVDQQGCAMKVGTDGVLLGIWSRLRPTDKRLLDIGTGIGIIALILAQRTESWKASVSAVEIDPLCSAKARENFAGSAWGERMELFSGSIQNFTESAAPYSFDHIVSNPPYFTASLPSPDAARNTARHTGTLSHGEIIEVCGELLKPDGRLSMILPSAEGEKIIDTAGAAGLNLSRRTEVWPTARSGPKRLLLEFSRPTSETELSTLIIEDAAPGTFSEEYRTLTRDFYLYF